MLEDTAPLLSSIPALCVIFTLRHRLLSCPGCPELAAQTDFELDPPASAFQVGSAGLCPQTSSVEHFLTVGDLGGGTSQITTIRLDAFFAQ